MALKYYEYGRYDRQNLGLVVKARNLPDVKVIKDGIDHTSLKKTLAYISGVSGQSGRIQAVYITVENKYDAMLKHAETRKSQNANPKRRRYDLLSYSCVHFVKEVTEKAGVKTPWMADPRPNSYIGEFRDEFLDLDYKPGSNTLVIESIGKL